MTLKKCSKREKTRRSRRVSGKRYRNFRRASARAEAKTSSQNQHMNLYEDFKALGGNHDHSKFSKIVSFDHRTGKPVYMDRSVSTEEINLSFS